MVRGLEADHDHILDLIPPLLQGHDLFTMRAPLAGSVTSVFFASRIDGRQRWFHGYGDLADRSFAGCMRADIIARESRPVRAMSRQDKLDQWRRFEHQKREWKRPEDCRTMLD